MLDFFRKYQRYFFLLVTIVIIISFSFFGTYSTLTQGNYHEQIAFTAVDGTQVKRAELDQLALFLGTDAQDKLLFGGLWGPNFLNDGVIKKDFLETGLAELLASQYPVEIDQDLQLRLEKEKRYSPYTHPQAYFLGADTAWSYFAPAIKKNLEILRLSPSATAPEALEARINLFLAERNFPSTALRQVLMYQQRQYAWLKPDPDLDRIDLSLFGYHTLDDWFGPRFMRLIGEFIINSSIIAEQRGYTVSQAEALADLMQNAEKSFKQNLTNPHLGVANSGEYFNEQLNRMGLNQSKAAQIWQKVLLFRRLFQDMGNSVFVDPLTIQNLNSYSKATIEGNLFRLPKEFRFNHYRDLQKFEIYLEAISKKGEGEKDTLSLPTQFLSVEEVAKKNPELVQKRYLLEVAHVEKNALAGKIGLKETWNWEADEKNWAKLKKQFPELGVKKGETREERVATLDSLNDKTRSNVDAFARKEIVESHPEWLKKALQDAEMRQMTVGVKLKGGAAPLAGVENREQLIELLDAAKLGEQSPNLEYFTGDQQNYYRIQVVDRIPEKEILTFAEAQKEGVLEPLLAKKLEAYYLQIRDSHPKQFQNDNKSWRPFSDIQDEVADLYFANLLQAIQTDYAAALAPEPAPKQLIHEMSAALRLYKYARDVLAQIKKNPAAESQFVQQSAKEANALLAAKTSLAEQWRFDKSAFHAERSNQGKELDMAVGFEMQPGNWSNVQTSANGDLFFFELEKKGTDATPAALDTRIDKARTLLSDDAQRVLMEQLLREMKDKKAISLDYLSQGSEMTEG
jgi:GcvH upstream region-like protein